MTDVAVVGGGIVGLAVARELSRRGRQVVVLEREDRLGAHQTSHNSGVIHQGIYYAPGSLKARLCREGADALYDYCAEQGIPAEPCGKLVVAVRDADLPRLDDLEERGRRNGVPGLERVGPAEMREIEPEVAGLAALHSPRTGIVDFSAVAEAYAREVARARRRGPHGRRRASDRSTGPTASTSTWGQILQSSISRARWRAAAPGRTCSPCARARRPSCASSRSAAPT